jgi:hypothetical protein
MLISTAWVVSRRVRGWRAMHAVTRGHWISRSFMARVRAGAEATTSPRLSFMVPKFMGKSIKVTKKPRGRPATGRGTQIGERWHRSELAAIDAWIAGSMDKMITRAHAVRRLVALGLKAKTPTKVTRSLPNKLRAAELAAKTIEKMIDPGAPADERDQRRRRLTKGPPEFRDHRVDLPKAKK